MESHTLFARSQITKLGSRRKEKYEKIWKDLANISNNYEGATKNVNGSKKVHFKIQLINKLN